MEDYVSQLQMWIQRNRIVDPPNYVMSERIGEPHSGYYESCSVYFNGWRFTTTGRFTKHREAKQAAARQALISIGASVPKVEEVDEVDEVIVFRRRRNGKESACYLFDADNVSVTEQLLESLISDGNEVHLFYSVLKNDEQFRRYKEVHLHPTKAFIPEMSDHCISWWVCERKQTLSAEQTRVYIISKDKGMQAIVALAKESGVNIEQRVQV